jgi:cytochrome c-type biogenesis protein
VFIVAGLALTFTLMGVVSSLFGAAIGSRMAAVEKIAGGVIILFGLLMLLNVNLFKHLSFFSRFGERSRGRLGGFLLGFTLGIIWIPCIGPMLSSVLAVVALRHEIFIGAGLLLVYSLGFAVPMLTAAYASQFFRARLRSIGKHSVLINSLSGVILIVFGVFIEIKGIIGFSF